MDFLNNFMYLNMLIMYSLPLKIKICFTLLIDYVVIIKKKFFKQSHKYFFQLWATMYPAPRYRSDLCASRAITFCSLSIATEEGE